MVGIITFLKGKLTMVTTQADLEVQLREAIMNAETSHFKIARETGLAKSALCRFMQGKTLTLPSAEKLIRYFDFEITKKQKEQETN